jgi:ribose transport system permease protein
VATRSEPLTPRAERQYGAAIGRFVADNSTVLVVLLLLTIFGLTSQNFLTANNIFNIWRQMTVVAILAIGMTMVILIGGIDLSVSSVLYLCGGVTAVLIRDGAPTLTAILIGLAAATAVGLLNGVIVEIVGISPVIATLGTLIGIRGLAQVVMRNAQVRVTDPFFEWVASERILTNRDIGMPGIPLMVIIMVVLYIIAAILLRRTTFGRYVYAIGGNQRAAYLCGVPVIPVKVATYTLCGFFAGIAGLLLVASNGVLSPNLGAGMEFFTIAAVVLGGTSLSGGVGRVEKTLLGAMLLYMVLNYMTLRRIEAIWQQTVTGLLVLVAVVLDRIAQRVRPT